MEKTNKKVIWGLLFAILLAAFLVRFTNISNLPAGLYPDEAVNGMDALEAIATNDYKLFYESNNGREGLFINLQALSIEAFGNNMTALKLWSIIFGTLTVLGVFLLTSELFANQYAGLFGAYMTAFSYWAINFSRIGFRAIMLPFILSFAFYFLFKGLRTKKLHDFLISGLIYGLGLHTYIAFRVSPLVLIVLLVSLTITRKQFLKTFWKHILVFAIAMFITAAPMLLDFFYWNPQHYTSRTSDISVFNPEVNDGNIFPVLVRTFGLSLAKYNFWGDQNMRQNYAPYPILNPLTGITFAIGLIYIILDSLRLLWLRFKKGIRNEKFDVHIFLLTWFLALLIPEFLAAEGNPHALRSIGTLPAVMIISTIPFIWLLKKTDSFGHSFKMMMFSFFVFSLIFIGTFDTIKYFVFFANSPKHHEAFSANLKEEANFIMRQDPSIEKIVIAENMQRIPIKFLTNKLPNIKYYYKAQVDQISPKNPLSMIILMDDKDDQVISNLQSKFPGLNLESITNSFGDTFYIFKY